jgi:hypothetical protein
LNGCGTIGGTGVVTNGGTGVVTNGCIGFVIGKNGARLTG